MGVRRRRAFVVPDPQAWAVWGRDLHDAGVEVAHSPERAELMVLPSSVPRELARAVDDAADRLPGNPSAVMVLPGPAELLGDTDPEPPAAAHDAHAGHGDHADHGDMMAIVGDASDDGLVMEAVTLTLGPLGSPMPGGLVAKLSLDGDVVASAHLQATLRVMDPGTGRSVADPLMPLAWRAVLAAADGQATVERLAALEVERALSHAAWAGALAAVLGHGALADVTDRAVRVLVGARNAVAACGGADAVAAITDALGPVERLERMCCRDRGLRSRLRGVASVDPGGYRRQPVGGPNARAAGLRRDVRLEDPRYLAVGFAPVLDDGSDALARTRVRGREAAAALSLARRLLVDDVPDNDRERPVRAVEGPRGPLLVVSSRDGAAAVAAPGGVVQRELAADAVEGLELSSALAGLVSFDLSPWRVGE